MRPRTFKQSLTDYRLTPFGIMSSPEQLSSTCSHAAYYDDQDDDQCAWKEAAQSHPRL